jgi:hypothetical protein
MIGSQLTLSGWVGAKATGSKGAGNLPADVIKVQDILNAIPVEEGGPSKLLSLDGKAGPLTQKAIQEFQLKHFGWKTADGRVDPEGKAWNRMMELLSVYGGTNWSIRRMEQRLRPDKPFRDAQSRDRFYEIHSANSQERAVYYFQTPDQNIPRGPGAIPFDLDGLPEFAWFQTNAPCSVYAFTSRTGIHFENSSTERNAEIRVQTYPMREDAAPSGLSLRINHTWIIPTTAIGLAQSLSGSFRFMRAQCLGARVQKTPRLL